MSMVLIKRIEDVKRYARHHGLTIVSAGFYHSWVDKNVPCNPFEFLSLAKGAECIIVDTFHGSIFAMREGRLEFDDLGAGKAVQSQDAGLRHRKIGIVDRLEFERDASRWVPAKRLATGIQKKPKFKREKQLLRVKMRVLSHTSFKQAKISEDINVYLEQMAPVYSNYKQLAITLKGELESKLKGIILRTLKIMGYKRT